jgi:hypothetical protein
MIFHGHIFEPEEQYNLNVIYNYFLLTFLEKASPKPKLKNSREQSVRKDKFTVACEGKFKKREFYENYFNKTFHIYENVACQDKYIANIKNNIIPNKIKSDILLAKQCVSYFPHQNNVILPSHSTTIWNSLKLYLKNGLMYYFETFCNLFSPIQPHFEYEINPINDMNEIYLSVPGGQGSDHIFERKHVDGPFLFLPYCYVYRCILGLSCNNSTITKFEEPFSFLGEQCKKNIKSLNIKKHKIKGITVDMFDYVAFDYNRQPHYICSTFRYNDPIKKISLDPTDKNAPRVVYKLHYIIYPTFLPKPIVYFYKKIHILYNSLMRTFFVSSQNNNSIIAWIINNGNDIYYNLLFRKNKV